MIISLNWLKKYTNVDLSVDELALIIGARLVEIEEVVDYGKKYSDAIVVKAVNVEKMEGSDHLSVAKIDDGGVNKKVERDIDGLVQVVCGAPNIATGQMVVWLPPESIVPETFGKAEQFKLDARKLRGVVSNGMIASARELDLSDEHEGILVLDGDLKPGDSFASHFELDDYLLDIENKSLTHRPDCFGIIGFAREVAAIQGNAFITPDWLKLNSTDVNDNDKDTGLRVIIDNPELSDRYSAAIMSDIDNSKQSPLKIQTYLSRIGVRPISAVVDVTNYLMMLTGQPLHAFDYDKLVAVSGGKPEIHVRSGRNKETLELLDGKVIELDESDIVIAAGETAIGLAGAMGGANTAIDANTKNIIIESATFNLYNLRATQMRHGIFSEAITRFTKGQPAGLSEPVLSEAIRLTTQWTGAKCAGQIVQSYPGKADTPKIVINIDEINSVLGSTFTSDAIQKTLQNVGFETVESNGSIEISVPYWRADIHIVEDIIEEIGRLNGFDNINPTLPVRDFTASMVSEFDDFRAKIRKILVRSGANEVLTYSFIHGNILEKANQKSTNSYRIVNSISPDLQYYRQTLTPSLLGLVHPNIKQGYDEFALFEVNKAHQKDHGLTTENVPIESDMLSLVIANKSKQSSAPYYQAKKMFDYLVLALGIEFDYKTVNQNEDALFAPFEPRRSGQIVNKTNGDVIGVVGEYKKTVAKGFKLPDYVAGFEVDIKLLFDAYQNRLKGYSPLSKFPGSERDICFQVNDDVTYSQIIESAQKALNDIKLESIILPIDIYQPENKLTKNITIRIRLTAHDHTLTGAEVSSVIDTVIESVKQNIEATVI